MSQGRSKRCEAVVSFERSVISARTPPHTPSPHAVPHCIHLLTLFPRVFPHLKDLYICTRGQTRLSFATPGGGYRRVALLWRQCRNDVASKSWRVRPGCSVCQFGKWPRAGHLWDYGVQTVFLKGLRTLNWHFLSCDIHRRSVGSSCSRSGNSSSL